MRKALTLFILIVTLVQVMGYYIAFRVRQMEIKTEVRTYLKSHPDDLHVTHFQLLICDGRIQDDSIKWEDEDEFEIAGSMYDVIAKEIKEDRIIIHCLKDKRENELLKSFEHLQKNHSQEGKNRSASLLELFGNLYVAAEATAIPQASYIFFNAYPDYHFILPDRCREIITPPPRNC